MNDTTPAAMKHVTVAEIRAFINGVIAAHENFSTVPNPIEFLMIKILQHFKGAPGTSPVVLRPLLMIEIYKEDVPRIIIENVRRDVFSLRDYCLDYPEINKKLDKVDQAFQDLLGYWDTTKPVAKEEDLDVNEFLDRGEADYIEKDVYDETGCDKNGYHW